MNNLLPVVNRCELLFTHGKGAYLYTENNEKYLDFISGVAVNVFGHADEKITEIVSNQAKKMMHISNYFRSHELEAAAEKLTNLTIGGKVFFLNSGAESVDTAIKVSRRYFWHKKQSEKYEIICFKKSFHGRTLGAIAAQGNEKYLEGFEPRLEGFKHAELNNIESVKALITKNTAAIMLEPIQGEGGVSVCEKDFILQIKHLCSENNLLLIFDEVQCGVGRTGKLYAFEHYNVMPDILITAKGLAAGIPIGACICTNEIAECMTIGSHGSTFGGNPFAMSLVNYVLDTISKPEFLQNISIISDKIKTSVEKVIEKTGDKITEIRGKGLLLGVKLNAKYTTQELVLSARKHKLLLAPTSYDNVVRLLPRLNTTDGEISDFEEKLYTSIIDL